MKNKVAMIAALIATVGLAACAQQQQEEVVVPVEPEPVTTKY
jgi:nitrous oxide reductase accessory protein NosL